MIQDYLRREALCKWLVKEILFGNLSPPQERAAQRVYHNLQMNNSKEEEQWTTNFIAPWKPQKWRV